MPAAGRGGMGTWVSGCKVTRAPRDMDSDKLCDKGDKDFLMKFRWTRTKFVCLTYHSWTGHYKGSQILEAMIVSPPLRLENLQRHN